MNPSEPCSSSQSKLLRIQCYRCKLFTSKKKGTLITSKDEVFQSHLKIALEKKKIPIPVFGSLHYLCPSCSDDITETVQRSLPQPEKKPKLLNWDERVSVIKRFYTCSRLRCFICTDTHQENLRDLPKWTKVLIYNKNNVYLGNRLRCCVRHLDNIESLLEDTAKLPAEDKLVEFTQRELYDWDQLVRNGANETESTDNIFAFAAHSSHSNEDYKILLGVDKGQFEELCEILVKKEEGGYSCKRSMVAMFLMKMRQNSSDSCLKVLFNINSRQYVSTLIDCTRKLFMKHFVPRHLGVNHITREDFIKKHNTELVNQLYFGAEDPNAVLVVDGTHIYIEKSSNYLILKRSFCVHKGRHLVKPTMIVGSDGYILEVLGPHMADSANSDAKILKSELIKEYSQLKAWLEECDIFIVDRGYRDCITFLEELGFLTHMPHFMRKGEKQHSTEEANESRLVTKSRWIVEKRNGDVKQVWKFLNGTIRTAHLVHVGDFFRIGCALLNAFYPTINPKDNPYWLSEQLLDRARQKNLVMELVDKENIRNVRKNYTKMTAQEMDLFPILSEDDLRNITLGSYQLKQAANYTALKQSRDGQLGFEIYMDAETKDNREHLLRCRLWSKYKSTSQYKTWILYDEVKNGPDGVLGWYCDCAAGTRTVGCCAHVAAILWWLGNERRVVDVFPSTVPSAKVLSAISDAADRQVNFPTLVDDSGPVSYTGE